MVGSRSSATFLWLRYIGLLSAFIALTHARGSPYTIIELRHDCSDTNPNPLIERDLWTTVVYRLKTPIYERCTDKLDSQFIWRFHLAPETSCLAMLGCHDLEGMYDPVLGREVFDVNVTVNRLIQDDVTGEHAHLDTFQITRDGHQKFYNLTGGESVQMTFQYKEGADNKTKNIICFAWCNEDLNKQAPIMTTPPPTTTPPTSDLVEDIENCKNLTVDLSHEDEEVQVSPAAIYRMTEMTETCTDARCQLRYSFFWLANYTCYSKFLCTKMEGRACETFGVELTHSEANEDPFQSDRICQAEKLVTGSLNASQKAHIDLWYQRDNPYYQATCFFWCTKDGQLPHPRPEHEIDYELKQKVVEGTWKTHKVQLGPESQTILISPVTHYNITQPAQVGHCSQSQPCKVETIFKWKGSDSCRGKFICSTLDGNICGQYGLKIEESDASNNEDICYMAQKHSFSLATNQSVTLEYWYNEDTSDDVVCHLWCNEEGYLPLALPDSNVQEGLLDTLLSSPDHLSEVAFPSGSLEETSSVPISPSLIYKMSTNGSHETCSQGICSKEIGFAWRRRFQCQARFICTVLNHNICGDYGIKVSAGNAGDVCYRQRLRSWTMDFGQEVDVSLWWYDQSNFEATCYMWCSKDGHPPQGHQTDPVNQDLVLSLAQGNTKIVQISNGLTREIPSPEAKYLSYITVYSLSYGQSNARCDEEHCYKTWTLQWSGSHSITMGFFMASFAGHICGDFGLRIGSGEQLNQEVCFAKQFHLVQLEPNQVFNVLLWYAKGSSHQFQAYTWAHSNGNFPTAPEKRLENQLLMNLMNGSLHIETKELSQDLLEEDVDDPVAFSTVYHFNLNRADSQGEKCDQGKCLLSHDFTWFLNRKCLSNFLCTTLKGNVCGSYGIDLKYESEFRALTVEQRVCYENHIHSGHLSYQDKLTFGLWYMEETSFEAQCYFWCTPDGKLPLSSNSKADADQISQLVSGSRSVHQFSLSSSGSSSSALALSPVIIYQMGLSSISEPIQGCSNEKCLYSFLFRSRSSRGCEFRFVCSRLEEEPCGDYGLELAYPAMGTSTDKVCHAGEIHRSTLETDETTNVTLWHMKEAAIDAQCYAWCTPNGEMPMPSGSSDQIDADLMRNMLNTSDNVIEIELGTDLDTVLVSSVNLFHFSSESSTVSCSGDDSDRCSISRKFQLFNDLPLKFSIVMDQLIGNVCGDFGVSIARGNAGIIEGAQDQCHQGTLATFDVGEYDFITITIWFFADSQVSFSGYFWATSTGRLPSNPQGVQQGDIISSIATRGGNSLQIHLETPASETSFSPIQIYRFSASDEGQNCVENKCVIRHEFDWNYQGKFCMASILCSKLTNNICGDYGIKMTSMAKNSMEAEIQSVCYPNTIYHSVMDSSKHLEIALWYSPKAQFQAQCYLWCSDDGFLPAQETENMNEELVQALINGSGAIRNITMKTISNGQAVSPVFVYHFLSSSQNVPACTKDKCSASYTFSNLGRKSCQASLICSSLSGNVCGDYGLNMDVTDSSQEVAAGSSTSVCKKGFLYRTSLRKGSSLALSLWYDGGSDFVTKCFFWCTPSGSLPQRRSSASINDNLILELLKGNFHVDTIQLTLSNQTHAISPQTVYSTNQSNSDSSSLCINGNCFQRYRFDYHGSSNCTSKFICTSLSGNICGNYGLTLLYTSAANGDLATDACHENELFVQELSEGDSAEVILWSVPEAEYNAQCYFWCTNNGDLPGARPKPDDTTLQALVNGTSDLRVFAFDAQMSSKPLSSVLVYHTQGGSKTQAGLLECEEHKCFQYYKFQWAHEESCKGTFICSELADNPCGDFGLTLSYSNDDRDKSLDHSSSVCYQGHPYQYEMNQYDTIDMSLWFLKNATYSYSCYYWCTSDGKLPKRPQKFVVKSETLESLANGSRTIQKIELESQDRNQANHTYVSPTTIYNTIQIRNDSSDACQDDQCRVSYRFAWLGTEACNSSFVCSKLGGNPCADYGIQLQINGQEPKLPVCYQGQLHLGVLETNDYIDISLWHLKDSSFNSSCYLWCTDNGKLPQPRQTSNEYEDLVMALMNGSRSMENVEMTTTDGSIQFVSPKVVYAFEENNGTDAGTQLGSSGTSGQFHIDPTLSLRHIQFGWLGNNVCHAHLFCLELSGNICGDYGLVVEVNETTEKVCYEREIHRTAIEKDQTTEVTLWYAQEAIFNAECFFWCTTDGEIPEAKPDTSKNDELIAKLIEQTNAIQRFNFSLETRGAVVISMVNVYEVSLNQGDFTSCNGTTKCTSQIEMNWLLKQPGQWNYICTKLKGNICGDYGLQLSTTNDQTEDVCFEGELHHGQIESHDSLSLSLWFTQGALFDLRCYFWATEDGHLPRTVNTNPGSESIIKSLADGSDILKEIIMGVSDESAVSSAFIYIFNVESGNLDQSWCQDDICTDQFVFQYHREKSCDLHFLCSSLSPSVCGDHGLELIRNAASNESFSQDVCYQGQVHQVELNQGDELQIELWFQEGIKFEASCFLWCASESGQIITGNTNEDDKFMDMVDESNRVKRDVNEMANKDNAIAPHLIYNMDLASGMLEASDRQTYTFEWLGDEPCQATFICSELNGNICGDFGLEVELGNASRSDYCYVNDKRQGQLGYQERAEISLWMAPGAKFSVKCFFWCTGNGNLPTPVETKDTVDSKFMDELINTGLVSKVKFGSDQVEFLSPVKFYETQISSESLGECQEDRCTVEYEWKLSNPNGCQFKTVCTELSGNPCGDYGFELHSKPVSEEIQICHHHYMYSTKIEPGASLTLSLWRSPESVFQIKCFSWCSRDGWPKTEESSIGDEITEKAMSGNVKLKSESLTDPSADSMHISHGVVYHFKVDGSTIINTDGEIRTHKQSFLWLNDKGCQANLVCSKMQGNPCGTYGLGVKFQDGEKVDICTESRLVSGTLEPNTTATISLWHVPNPSDMEMTCFFWCSIQGQFPEIDRIAQVDDKILEELVNSTRNVEDVVLTNELQSGSISTAKIYHITGLSSDFHNCSTVKCRMAMRFQYLASESCQFGFVCSSMEGNPCGSYGIKLKPLDNDEPPINVCHAGQMVNGSVQFQESFEIRLWYTHQIEENPTCYFWCTPSGALPEPKDSQDQPDEKIISDLATDECHTQTIDITDKNVGESAAIASQYIYNLNVNTAECDQDKCSISKTFTWYGDKTCQARVMCTNLGPGMCAEYGLNVVFGNAPIIRVCQNNSLYRGSLGYEERLSLNFWYTRGFDLKNLNCYTWCSSDGSVPQEHPGTAVEQDLIDALISGSKNEKEVAFNQDNSQQINLAPNYIYEIKGTNENLGVTTEKTLNTLTFNWLWNQTCEARLVCRTLGGQPCGDYGLSLASKAQNQSICKAGMKVQDKLAFNEALQLKLWYTSKSKFDFTCFLWCTEDGHLPKDTPSAFIDETLVIKIMNGSEITKQIENEDTPISSSTIYKNSGSSTDFTKCSDTTCSKEYKLQWHGNDICQAKFICPKLSGDICGDYGIVLNFPETQLQVCQERFLYEGELTSGETLTYKIWYSQASQFQFECFMWCTENGVIPQPHHDSKDSSNQLATLTNGSSNVQIIDISSSSSILSTSKVYEIGLNSEKNPACNETKCWMNHRIQYFGEEECQSTFICSLLSGNPCGDYQLSLHYSNLTESVCFEAVAYRGRLAFNENLEISLWHTSKAKFEFSCFFWCSSKGHMPIVKDNSQEIHNETSQLILDIINGNEASKRLGPPSTEDTTSPLSASTIYHFKLDTSDVQECEGLKCEAKYQFQWLWEETCQLHMVCNRLSGNICGDYGLQLELADWQQNQHVCYPNHIYEAFITFYSSLTVSLWYLQNAAFEVECQFWCSNNGLPPSKPNAENTVDKDALNALIKGTTHMHKLTCAVGINNTIPMAPNKVFVINQKPSTFQECPKDAKCQLQHDFTWMQPNETCQFAMVCSELTNEPCANYATMLQSNQNETWTNLCHENQIYKAELQSGQSVVFREWYAGTWDASVTCYAWCSKSGNVPTRDQQATIDEELFNSLIDPSNVVVEVKLPSNTSVISIESDKVYHLRHGSNYECAQDSICRDKIAFKWDKSMYGCNGTFMCSKMNGHACGDYQVSWRYQGQAESKPVCEVNQAHIGYLEPGQRAHLDLWHTEGSSKDWECYFTCRENAKSNDDCDCGQANKSEDQAPEYPWQVQILKAVRDGFEFVCSGALVGEGSVITSAHCFGTCREVIEANGVEDFRIVVGKSRMKDPRDNSLITKIRTLHLHPKFSMSKQAPHPSYDIAVVQLQISFGQFSASARPICLPLDETDQLDDGSEATMVGWGAELGKNGCGYAWYDHRNQEWFHTPSKIIYPDVATISKIQISASSNETGIAHGQVLGTNEAPGSCQGDSGSPLMAQGRNGKYTLVGIASYGSPSCHQDEPIGFTSISTNYRWITSILGQQCP